MKIRYRGLTTFQLTFDNLTVATDPLALIDYGLKLNKLEADVALFTQDKLQGKNNVLKGTKVEPVNREGIMEITTPGEYEIAEVIIRRPVGKSYYMIDYGPTRAVYIGVGTADIDPKEFDDVGDVEALMIPVGNGEQFPDYDKLGKIISNVDPLYLLPCGYKMDGTNGDLKSVKEFIKHFGYTHITEEKFLHVKKAPEMETKNMQVVILDSK